MRNIGLEAELSRADRQTYMAKLKLTNQLQQVANHYIMKRVTKKLLITRLNN